MSITPLTPSLFARGRVTWVKSQWKLSAYPGQFSVEINSLAEYSMAMLKQVEEETGIDFDATSNGIFFPCRDEETLKGSAEFCGLLTDLGLNIEPVDEARAVELVPAFRNRSRPLAGGMYSRNCRTGNARKFAQNLLDWCVQHQGCKVLFNTEATNIVTRDDRVEAVQTSSGEYRADEYVLSAGPFSGKLHGKTGKHLPICPVKGFSITARIIDPSLAPTCGVADENSPVAASVMGENLRIASSAVFDGFNLRKSGADFYQILSFAHEMLPGVADYDRALRWSGLRPMTPSSVPLIGRSRLANMAINTGHGHLGWTLACGSAQLVADVIFSRKTGIDIAPYQRTLM